MPLTLSRLPRPVRICLLYTSIGDRITVRKDGRTVATKNIEDVASDEEIVSMMVGRELKNNYFNREMSHVKDKVIFEAKNIVRRDRRVNDVSFTLREGEILGFAGLVGAGRTELMNVIFGAERMQSGEIWLDGRRIFVRSPYHSIKDGIGTVSYTHLVIIVVNSLRVYFSSKRNSETRPTVPNKTRTAS